MEILENLLASSDRSPAAERTATGWWQSLGPDTALVVRRIADEEVPPGEWEGEQCWLVARGEAALVESDRLLRLRQGTAVWIPAGLDFRIRAAEVEATLLSVALREPVAATTAAPYAQARWLGALLPQAQRSIPWRPIFGAETGAGHMALRAACLARGQRCVVEGSSGTTLALVARGEVASQPSLAAPDIGLLKSGDDLRLEAREDDALVVVFDVRGDAST